MSMDLSRHPCFDPSARHRFGRIHLPVAPSCNIQCRYCRRDHDCPNESRPGVTSALLSPQQAAVYLERVMASGLPIAVTGIAGPGDPFASPEVTLETLRLVRARYPEMLLCVASNGLAVAPYAAQLAELKLSHATLTINAVDAEVGQQIYAWVRDGKRIHRGRAGAELLWTRQQEALRELKRHGVTVKVNTILVPGVNDQHVAQVADTVARLGADVLNCVPFYPVEGTDFATVEAPTGEQLAQARADAGQHLPLMSHCTRCRADAVGLLGQPVPTMAACAMEEAAALPILALEDRPYVAAATAEGVLVNQHLGEAERLSIFARSGDSFRLVETRPAPPPGGGQDRWMALARTLGDCRALLVASAGQSPLGVLAGQGIRVVMMEGLIEEGLDAVFRGAEIRSPLRREHRCGSGCAGSGTGCN